MLYSIPHKVTKSLLYVHLIAKMAALPKAKHYVSGWSKGLSFPYSGDIDQIWEECKMDILVLTSSLAA